MMNIVAWSRTEQEIGSPYSVGVSFVFVGGTTRMLDGFFGYVLCMIPNLAMPNACES